MQQTSPANFQRGVSSTPVFKVTDDRRKCAFKDADLIELRAKMACFRL